tara:strand:+ start:3035 stop:4489 length:1455 start_codon:yes stop_codon:yes gene_type:complete
MLKIIEKKTVFTWRQVMRKQNDNDVAIKVEDINKNFRLNNRKFEWLKTMMGIKESKNKEEVYALRDINFEIRKGESMAIIGENGSGKSTLLQIICGTLMQSSGQVSINGRVAALLELGSGFNPDFTGRENIILNGILLGLKKREVINRMEEIIDFAELGLFIDQPLRTYSSGMVVRLAFAIITNVDADILIIDEALAVGDAYFTQKCMRFIQRFKNKGTLIFVSHDPNAIMALCSKAVLLDKGRQKLIGIPKEVLSVYNRQIANKEVNKLRKNLNDRSEMAEFKNKPGKESEELSNYKMRWTDYRAESVKYTNSNQEMKVCKFDPNILSLEDYGGEKAKIVDVQIRILEKQDEEANYIRGGEIVQLTIKSVGKQVIKSYISGFIIKNDMGQTILGDNTLNTNRTEKYTTIEKGEEIEAIFIFTIPMLKPGKYSVTASVAEGTETDHRILHWINESIIIESRCDSIAAGIAGVTMHSIKVVKVKK